MRFNDYLKKLFGTAAFVSFFLLIGSAGALDCETVSESQGFTQMLVFLGLFILFTYLAGGFKK